MAIEEGKPAPDFTLRNAKGEKVALEDFRGRDVIVYFYPRDNTPGCTKEAEGFREMWEKIQARGVAVVGISPDTVESHDEFACKLGLPFPLLSDPDKKVLERYGAYGEKISYGKKVKGVIRSTVWVGPDGKIKKHWRKIADAADHPAEVLAELEAGA